MGNGFMLIQYPSGRTMARMLNDPDWDNSLKRDETVFSKNKGIPARVLNDGLTTIPSPLATFQKQIPTDCENIAWQRARKAENGTDTDGKPCNIDDFKDLMADCIPAALQGHCGKNDVCKKWMLSSLQA